MKAKYKKLIVSIVISIIALLVIIAIFDSWNTMWYDFGKNIYNFLHK